MSEPRAGRPGANVTEVTVSELSASIKRSLEDGFGFVRLRGEISGYRGPHSSGHCYFALKDDKAKIDAVIWKGGFQRLRFKPAEGLEVIAQGRLTSYPNSSKYQIVVDTLEPAGIGALMALVEERRRQLTAEGLFADERKRKLPFLPGVVGIITSPTGAAIRDMLAGFTERFPTRVIIWPVRVQGETCAAEVAAAIRGFNALTPGGRIPRPDVLIVARGGGSLEDLWGFNEEIVVRAAAASRIPLVSAVGHETDWTLLDLAADGRAPTPTKAAEWAVPKYSELLERGADLGHRLHACTHRAIERHRAHWKAAARGLPRLDELLALPRQRFDAVDRRLARGLLANTHAHAKRLSRFSPRLHPRLLASRLERCRARLDRLGGRAADALVRGTGARRARLERLSGRLQPMTIGERVVRARERLAATEARRGQAFAGLIARGRRHLASEVQMLAALSYQRVLGRGFALVRDEHGRPVRQAASIRTGMRIDLEFADGHAGATGLAEPRPSDPPGDQRPPRTLAPAAQTRIPKTRTPSSGGQGSLF